MFIDVMKFTEKCDYNKITLFKPYEHLSLWIYMIAHVHIHVHTSVHTYAQHTDTYIDAHAYMHIHTIHA